MLAPYEETILRDLINPVPRTEDFKDNITSTHGNLIGKNKISSLLPPFPHPNRSLISDFFPRHSLPSLHPCRNFALPPPAPANGKRTGARRKLWLFCDFFHVYHVPRDLFSLLLKLLIHIILHCLSSLSSMLYPCGAGYC